MCLQQMARDKIRSGLLRMTFVNNIQNVLLPIALFKSVDTRAPLTGFH